MKNNGSMSSRERVQNLIYHRHVNQIPKGEICINDDTIIGTSSYLQSGFDEKYNFIRTMGYDLVTLSPNYPSGLCGLPSAEEYVWPDLKQWITQTSLFTFAILDGAFEWGLRIFGLQKFFNIIKRSPDSLRNLIRNVEKFNLSAVEKLAAEGINGIILADDIAFQNGLFVDPEILRRLFIPSLTRQTEVILARNIPLFYHSDGNYLPVIHDIIKAGFTGIQCLEKSAGMDIKEVQRMFGSEICLWGHLEVDDIAKAGDSVCRVKLVESISQLGSHGNFILGTTSGIFSGTNLDLLRIIYKYL